MIGGIILGDGIILGATQRGQVAAAIYEPTTKLMIGQIFTGDDAEAQVAAFLGWLDDLKWTPLREVVGPDEPLPGTTGRSPCDWEPETLERLQERWRSDYIRNGQLKLV